MELDARYIMLIPVVMGVVEALKEFGVTGKWSKLAALVLSMIFVFGLVALDLYPEVSPWIKAAFQAIVLGLTAMGSYQLYQKIPGAINALNKG